MRDKRDRVRQLRVFCTAARMGSLTRAARHLGLTQPAVSFQLRDLESDLGAELFERGPAGVTLTPAGAQLDALARPLVGAVDALFDDFMRAVDEMTPARVRLAVSSIGATFVLPRYTKLFHDRHPDVAVRLDTVSFDEGCRRLLDEKVDFAFGTRDLDPDRERLRYHELLTYEGVLITARDHPLAGRASVSPSEAGTWRAVVPPIGTDSRQFGERVAESLGIKVDVAVEVGGWGMLKRYVEAGIGISVVPDLCLNEADRLAVVALDADFPRYSFGVFALRDRRLTPHARHFLEVLIENAPAAAPRRVEGPQRGA